MTQTQSASAPSYRADIFFKANENNGHLPPYLQHVTNDAAKNTSETNNIVGIEIVFL